MANTKKTSTSTKKSSSSKGKGSSNKKTNTKKKTNNKKKSNSKYLGSGQKEFSFAERHYGAVMLSYLLGGALLACLCFIKGFNVWTTIRSAAFSFFGIGLYLLVAQLIAVGIIMGLHKLKRSVLVTNICGFLFNATFTGLIHLFTVKISEGNMAEWKEQLSQCAKAAWEIGQGTFSLGGGIEGALFGGTLLHIFGKSGGVIFAVVIFAVSLFFFLNIDLEAFGGKVSEFITNGKSRMDDSAEQMKEKRILRQQEREERLLALQAEREQQEREEAEKRAKQQAQATADSADFDFNSTEVDNDVDTFVDNETGIPLRKIKKYYPEERIFSMGSETPTQQTVSQKAVSLSDMDFISERAPQTRTTRKQAAVPSDSISEGTVVRRNIETVEPQVVTEPEFVFDEEVSEAATDEAQQEQVSFSEIAQRASAQAESAVEKSMHDVATQPKQKKKQKKYTLPPLDCLNAPEFASGESFSQEMQTTAKKLVDILKSFGVETILVGISRGPTVTRYELAPAPGVKINKITNLEDDIALGLASTVRIEAPIPNKAAVGIEVPNKSKSMVTLREIISSEEYQKNKGKFLNVALGRDIAGNAYCTDLAPMPHLLIAGTTGSGKSVCLNCLIVSILYNATPEQVRLLMIDPKQVEFTIYNGIPHLLVPVITDARKAAGSLAWAVSEMDKRYKAFSNCGVRDIKSFNKYVEKHPELESMPQIVIFIDELNDLMMVSPKEVEDSICRLAQKARAAGIHLVVATQRPSVDVITGTIKANIPARLSLAVSSYVDSKTILDQSGAENLLGHGDMLFKHDVPKPVRIQGAYLSDEEIEKIVTFIKEQETTEYDSEVMEQIENNAVAEKKNGDDGAEAKSDKFDVLLDDAIDLIIASGTASTTAIQRKLSIGFSRAGRIMDQLEALGYVSPADGNKPRTVLISRAQYLESKAGSPPASDGDEDPDNYDIFSD